MLPPQLAELTSLKTIDARDNILEEVPWQLSNLPNLTSFLTDGKILILRNINISRKS